MPMNEKKSHKNKPDSEMMSGDSYDNPEAGPIAIRLVELSEEQLQTCREVGADWARVFTDCYRVGDLHFLNGGIVLQAIDLNTVRCIRIYDKTSQWEVLSLVKASLDAAKMTLELEPFTMVSPIRPRCEELGLIPYGEGNEEDAQADDDDDETANPSDKETSSKLDRVLIDEKVGAKKQIEEVGMEVA